MEPFPIVSERPVLESGPPATDYAQHLHDSIIIDNGATTLRAGWSSEAYPRIVMDNVGAKYRDRKTNRNVMLAGSEAYVDATSRAAVKSAFEGDIVCNFDQMELILDYIFYKLGVTGDTVPHPIIMTESLCNPHYSRALMSELLFEGYGVTSVTYGLDSLFSFHANASSPTLDGLVISSATANTHIIPVVGGVAMLNRAKKIMWGGSQAAEYMLKLMQLKYPTFPGRLSSFQAAIMYRDHCYFSTDYKSEIHACTDPRFLAAADRVIQFPFVPLVVEEKTEEELARQVEKKKEGGRRLQEQAAKQRLEKLVRQEEELTTFSELRASKGSGRKVDYEKRIKAAGFMSTEDLDEYLKKIEKSLQKARNKELGVDENEGKEAPTFPLVDIPDHMLNEEDLKEKRRQRLMKAGYDARIRAKAGREQDRLREEEEQKADQEAMKTDHAGWLNEIRKSHTELIEKIKERKKTKEQLSDRKSLAAQNRMKSIANLASDVNTGKKRKRGGQDDDFGKNDDDWAVYRQIGGEESDDEEDEQGQLKEVEARLLEHDPTFTIDHTAERLALRKHQLLNAFVRGLSPDDPLNTYDPESLAHASQLHLNVERIRVPEVVWQPHMGGLDQAGLAEVVEHVLKQFSPSERDRLTQNIFVTGGNTLIKNFDTRLLLSLRPLLASEAPLTIRRSDASQLDAWKGMAKWSQTEEAREAAVTRADYDRLGGEWVKEYGRGNCPTG